jgi:hypothetical protein
LGDTEGEAFVGVGVGLGERIGGGEYGGGLDAGVVVLGYFYGLVVDVCVAGAAVGGAVRGGVGGEGYAVPAAVDVWSVLMHL